MTCNWFLEVQVYKYDPKIMTPPVTNSVAAIYGLNKGCVWERGMVQYSY